MQKAAFEALQLQKDSVHAYIRNQVCWLKFPVGQKSQ